jgi:hypothetical protein
MPAKQPSRVLRSSAGDAVIVEHGRVMGVDSSDELHQRLDPLGSDIEMSAGLLTLRCDPGVDLLPESFGLGYDPGVDVLPEFLAL